MRRRVGRVCAGAVLSVTLSLALGGCGTASEPYAPTGVDELVIPTPSPSASDFVATIDNPWLALTYDTGTVYRLTGGSGTKRVVSVERGPEIQGVTTTALHQSDEDGAGSGEVVVPSVTTTDYLAQDARGNVWWFGREGEWQSGVDGAEAGLLMAAHPRFGDGYRSGPGLVAEVVAVDGTVDVPSGDYTDVVVIDTRDTLSGRVERSYYAAGVGLVHQETTAGDPAVVLDLVAPPS